MPTRLRDIEESLLFEMGKTHSKIFYVVEVLYDRVWSDNLIDPRFQTDLGAWTSNGLMGRTYFGSYWLLDDLDSDLNESNLDLTRGISANYKTRAFTVDLAQPSTGAAAKTDVRLYLSGGTTVNSRWQYTWATGDFTQEGTIGPGETSGRVESLSNGRKRITVTCTNNGTNNLAEMFIYPASPDASVTGAIEVWGAPKLRTLGKADRKAYSTGPSVSFNDVTALEGGVKVNPSSFTLDGGQGARIEFFNFEDNQAASDAIALGINDTPVKIWLCMLDQNDKMVVPMKLIRGVLSGANTDLERVTAQVNLSSAVYDIVPRQTYTYSRGFEHLPPRGTKIVWEGQTFQL